jgi:hypothetical protein
VTNNPRLLHLMKWHRIRRKLVLRLSTSTGMHGIAQESTPLYRFWPVRKDANNMRERCPCIWQSVERGREQGRCKEDNAACVSQQF